MADGRAVVIKFLADTAEINRKLDRLINQSTGFKSVLQGIGMGAGLAAFNAIGSAVSTVTDFMGDSVEAASGLQQSIGAVESVFGSASGKIERFGRTAAETMGLSRREVNEMASVTGAMLQSAGFSAEEAADHYMTLQQRAADMAATFGGDTKSAMEAISSLLRGERDPIERYGVSIKQADINARLAAEGLDHLEGEARKQAEAQVALAMLMEQTANVEGQFARETDSLAGSQAIAAAKFENAQAALGEKLLPIATMFFQFLSDVAIPVLMQVIDAVSPVIATIVDWASKIAKVLMPVVKALAPVVSGVFGTVGKVITSVVGTVAGLIGKVIGVFGNFGSAAGAAKDFVVRAFNNVVSFVTGLPGKIGNAVKGLWDGIPKAFKGALNTLIGLWNRLGFTMPVIDLPVIGRIGGFRVNVPQLPYFHTGGLVPGAPGSDVPAVLQAGEFVVPRKDVDRMGREIHIHFHGPVIGDGIEELFDQMARRLRLQGI